jgi:hypothetical protein
MNLVPKLIQFLEDFEKWVINSKVLIKS